MAKSFLAIQKTVFKLSNQLRGPEITAPPTWRRAMAGDKVEGGG